MAQQTDISKMETTAVDWLIEQLVELDKQLDGRRKSDDSTVIKLNPTKIYEQAKAMEKEEIINADLNGSKRTIAGFDLTLSERRVKELAEQYYNYTYENNK